MSTETVSDSIPEAVSVQADDLTQDDQQETSSSNTVDIHTFNLKPSLQDKFKSMNVRQTIQEVLAEELGGKVYSAENVKQWTTNIANVINRRVKNMKWKRYKHIVQVFIGEQRGAGMQSGVKCVWDSETDNYASEVFVNDSLFCVAVVFAIYFY